MTISTQNRTAGPYAGTGLVKVYSFGFKIFRDSDLLAMQTDTGGVTLPLSLTTDYTVVLNSDQDVSPGGNMVLATELPVGYSLMLTSNIPATQPAVLQNLGGFLPKVIEGALDRLTILFQQIGLVGIVQALRVPEIGGIPPLPAKALRANKVAAFDSAGNPVTIVGVDSGSAAALDLSLRNSATSATGSGQVKHGSANNYSASAPGSVGDMLNILLGVNAADPRWGLKLDGVTDDTVAANAMCAANPGKWILWPADKTVKLNGVINKGTTSWWAYGHTHDHSASNHTGISGTGGVIRGLVLLGAMSVSTPAYAAAGIGISCVGTNNAPAAPTFVTATQVIDCEIRNWSNYGVWHAYATRPIIQGCTFRNIGYSPIGGVSVSDARAIGNDILTVGPGTSGNAYGIFWDRLQGTLTAEPTSKRCEMAFNLVDGVTIWEALDTHAGEDFNIHDNWIGYRAACKHGIRVTDSKDGSGNPAFAPKRCRVWGNYINIPAGGEALTINGAFNVTTVDYAEDCEIGSNIITGGGTSGSSSTAAVFFRGTKNLRGNLGTVKNATGRQAVLFYFDNVGLGVSGGTIIDPHDAAGNNPACIGIASNNNTGVIGGFTFRYTGATFGADEVGFRSINIAAALTGLDLTLERCQFDGVDATHLRYIEGTNTGVNAGELCSEASSTALVAGTATVTFKKRFPLAPRVVLLGVNANRSVGYSSVTDTGMTLTGTSTDTISWRVST